MMAQTGVTEMVKRPTIHTDPTDLPAGAPADAVKMEFARRKQGFESPWARHEILLMHQRLALCRARFLDTAIGELAR